MKLFIYSILIIMILIGVNSAPKKFKKSKSNFNKKCNQCRVKGYHSFNPVCGRLNEIEQTFESRFVFECLAKCRKVEYFEFLYNGECQQTPEQCKAECDQNTRLRAPPACEGDSKGLKMTTYPYEALLDCYINCPDNNLTKLHQGPCIDNRHHPIYGSYGVLAPYHICFNRNNDTFCENSKLKAISDNYPMNFIRDRLFYRYF